MEDSNKGKEQGDSSESGDEKGKELTGGEGQGKLEVCLAEGEWEEQEVKVGEEYKDEEGVVWCSSVVREYERKKREERRRPFEKVRDQGLLKDFPNLKVGGLLPNPPIPPDIPKSVAAREWNMIVTPREAELQRKRENLTARFPEGPD